MTKSSDVTIQKGESVRPAERFQKLLDKYEDDPRYIAEGLLIEINEQVVHLMERKGINRTQLAALLDVSSAYVTKLLNGNENLTIKQLVRLSAALDSSVDVAIVPRQFKVKRLSGHPQEVRQATSLARPR
jgi:plasmid maintenance system antidote protein VapI